MIERIERATLSQPPLRRTDLRNVSPLWIGTAHTATGDAERLWLRQLPIPGLLAECYATVLGRALGLPIPRAFLVADPKGLVGRSDAPPLFGSLDAEHPSLRQRIDQADEPTILEALLKWPALRPCGCFDEQIANPDRNYGNLLFDGDQEWVAIDHAHALGGPLRWPGQPVAPAELVVNQVLNHLLGLAPELEGKRLPMTASYHAATWTDTPWDEVLDPDTRTLIDPDNRYPDVVSFMKQRLPLLSTLIQQRAQLFSPQHTLKL